MLNLHVLKKGLKTGIAFSFLLVFCFSSMAAAKTSELKSVHIFMMGNRLIDVAYNLGYIPEVAAAGCSSYIKKKIEGKSKLMGCPGKLLNKLEKTFDTIAKEKGITRFIVEKNIQSCTAHKGISDIKTKEAYSVETVDFSKGIDSAVSQVAKILDCPEKGEKLLARYNKKLNKVKKQIPEITKGKKVLILSGTYIEQTGKKFLQVETAGNCSDTYFLSQLGCENASGKLITKRTKIKKGMFKIRDLRDLKKAEPDVIAIVGNSFAVQKSITDLLKKDPELIKKVPAFSNLAVYSLPAYTDKSILDYPLALKQWADAMAD